MGSLNKCMLIGNLGKDPEVRAIPSGAKVANFSIATTETYTDKNNQKVEKTEWHNIVLWRGLAEVAEKYLKKGQQVYIEGRIQTRSWDDQNGQKRYMTEVVGDQMVMLGRPGGGGGGANGGREGGFSGGDSFRQEEPARQFRSKGSEGGTGNGYGSGGGYKSGGAGGGSIPPVPEDDLPF